MSKNTGLTDVVFLEMFKARKYEDFTLSEWMRRTPPKLVMEHLQISEEMLAKIPAKNYRVVPAKDEQDSPGVDVRATGLPAIALARRVGFDFHWRRL